MARNIDWERVVRSTLHSTQVEILEAASTRGRLSPIQFSQDRAGVNRVGYHFRALYKTGLLDAAGTAPKRGATEHFYRLSKRARST